MIIHERNWRLISVVAKQQMNFFCWKDCINEAKSIDWTLACNLTVSQYFYANNELILNK